MFMLVIKRNMYDTGHEPCYLSYYTSLADIRADYAKIKAFIHEEEDGGEDEEEVEYDEHEPSLYVTVIHVEFGLNTRNDMMTCFYDPKRDAEKTTQWGSGCTYEFAGNPNQFAEWIHKEDV